MSQYDKVQLFKEKRNTLYENIEFFEEYAIGINDDTDKMEIQIRLATVLSSFANWDEVHETLAILGVNDVELSKKREYKKRYYESIARARKMFKPAEDTVPNANNGRDRITEKFKIERAPLPKFSGKYEEWLSFKNKFISMTNSLGYSKVDKLTLLQNALEGDAQKKISRLDVSENNYDKAWDLLKIVYENKKITKLTHFNKILNLPKMQGEDHKILSQLADTANQCVEALQSLDIIIPADFIVCIIESKLDPNTFKLWEETSSHDDYEPLDTLTKFLYRTAARLSMRVSKDNKRKSFDNDGPASKRARRDNSYKPRSNGNNINNYNNSNNDYNDRGRQVYVTYEQKCCACKSRAHPLHTCETFKEMSIDDRWSLVKENKACFNCLRKHQNMPCHLVNCKHCKFNHNTLLHNFSRKPNPSKKNNDSKSTKSA